MAKTAAKVMKNSETHSVDGSQNGLNDFRLAKKGQYSRKTAEHSFCSRHMKALFRPKGSFRGSI